MIIIEIRLFRKKRLFYNTLVDVFPDTAQITVTESWDLTEGLKNQ